MSTGGWVGVDLDGTLAMYSGFKGPAIIGAPIPAMVERIKGWLRDGIEVRIFTARVWPITDVITDVFQGYHTTDPDRQRRYDEAAEAALPAP